VTGRATRSDTFSNLKQKRDLGKIFEQVLATYRIKLNTLEKDITRNIQKGDIDLEKVTLMFIIRCLENRQ